MPHGVSPWASAAADQAALLVVAKAQYEIFEMFVRTVTLKVVIDFPRVSYQLMPILPNGNLQVNTKW